MATMNEGYKVLSMNASDNGRKGAGAAEMKFDKICHILSEEQPDLVLLQECSSGKKLQRILDETQARRIPSYRVWEGPKDRAGGYQCILFNVNSLQMTPHDYSRTYMGLVDSRGISTDGEFLTRLFMRSLVSKGKPHIELLVATYHARNKLSDERKGVLLSELITMLNKEHTKTSRFILLGGDFNFELRKAKNVLSNHPDYHLYTAASEHKKTDDNMVDYFLYNGPEHHVHSVRVLYNDRQLFDHAPIVAQISQTKKRLLMPVAADHIKHLTDGFLLSGLGPSTPESRQNVPSTSSFCTDNTAADATEPALSFGAKTTPTTTQASCTDSTHTSGLAGSGAGNQKSFNVGQETSRTIKKKKVPTATLR